MKIFLIAYENIEILKLNLKYLKTISQMPDEDVIIIDMGFDKGIRSFLETQVEYNYICAEKLENYASILNTAMKEFSTTENIFILNDNYICLGDCLHYLEETCDSDYKIGMAFPTDFATICSQKVGISEALELIRGKADAIEAEIALKVPWQYIFLTRKFIDEMEELDEELLLPDSLMRDWSFRGLCQKWKMVSVKSSYVYEVVSQVDYYAAFLGRDVDRISLKAKWGMNYFNDIPNENLVNAINKNRDEEFTVLEVGCDCGANLMQIKRSFPKARLFGLEINSSAANVASAFCEVLIGNIEEMNLPYSETKFDYIIFGDVLEHLRNPEKVIEYCKYFLKPQGKIIASIPNLMHYTILKDLIGGNFTYQDTGLLDRTHIHFFTYYEIVRMFLQAGYQISSCTYTVIGKMSEEDKQFVADLKRLGGGESFFFLAYQYLVVADCND
ncbi:MAG: class I SAM-dependent methyltransferase [Lachnospiraceae bacterium]|nr:class I SAM-dependent methyltransferase [Lachnospiraceae bacterium]